MSAGDIFLVLISGLGVLHGLFLATFLWIYPKGNTISNRLLSLLLIILSLRIGKSVVMEFAEDLDIKLIFSGLGMLMAIGPLFYFYTKSYIEKSFLFKKQHLYHFVPFVLGFCFGLWINEDWIDTVPKVFFLFIFLFYYGHYLFYIIRSYRLTSKAKKDGLNASAYALLRLLFYGLLIVWVAYVLNLFDEVIPYIVGPILYSLVAYIVSFIVIQKGYIESVEKTKYSTTQVSDEQIEELYSKVKKIVITNQQFKNPELSLKSLSEELKVSSQVLSMVINKRSKTNFNGFINHHRIEEAIKLFEDETFDNHTIASIAYESGFNSITSFNSTFKKQTGKTPMAFRKGIIK
ncbi:MAG: helix-turn-helix transcriptional regulator [Reichenbachiella sp.]